MRDKRGRFIQGHSGGPGRPLGSRVKLSEAFLEDLHTAWEEHGVDVLERVIRDSPEKFLTAVSAVVPKDFRFEMNATNDQRLVVQLNPELAEKLARTAGESLDFTAINGECERVKGD